MIVASHVRRMCVARGAHLNIRVQSQGGILCVVSAAWAARPKMVQPLLAKVLQSCLADMGLTRNNREIRKDVDRNSKQTATVAGFQLRQR